MADRRDEAFNQAVAELIRELKTLEAEATDDVRLVLEDAQEEILRRMAAGSSDWDLARLTRLRGEISEILGAAGVDLGERQADHLDSAFEAGQQLIDRPVERAIGLQLQARLNSPDKRQLMAMKTFMTDRMTGISGDVAMRINSQLGLVLTGVNTPSQAIDAIAPQIDGGRARAQTVVRTELGRAFSDAGQQRQVQASRVLPGLRKQWRRSGKIHSRLAHDLADGQIRKPDEPFMVAGLPIMYPRDPKAPAAQTVNCGCLSLPYMAKWEMSNPGQLPITPEEMANSEAKRRIADVRASQVDRWAKTLLDQRRSGKARPTGSWHGVGQISPAVRQALAVRGVELASTEIAITDRVLLHSGRAEKQARGQALPDRDLRRIGEHMETPRAVLWDRSAKAPTLQYVFHVPGQDRLGVASVGLRNTKSGEQPRTHNRILTIGLVSAETLRDPSRFDLLDGGI